MRSFNPRMDVLPAAQKAIWPDLQPMERLGFVLYGGTAIALRLGHRTSVDFDFFTDQMLNKDILKQKLSLLKVSKVIQDSPETLTILVPNPVADSGPIKVSFFGSINFGRVGEPERTADGVLQVASLEDLFALKLKVILQRVESKDYLDIAALIKYGQRLDGGLAAASALYRNEFQPAESLKALVYFQGGDLRLLAPAIKKILIEAVRDVGQIPKIDLASRFLAEKL